MRGVEEYAHDPVEEFALSVVREYLMENHLENTLSTLNEEMKALHEERHPPSVRKWYEMSEHLGVSEIVRANREASTSKGAKKKKRYSTLLELLLCQMIRDRAVIQKVHRKNALSNRKGKLRPLARSRGVPGGKDVKQTSESLPQRIPLPDHQHDKSSASGVTDTDGEGMKDGKSESQKIAKATTHGSSRGGAKRQSDKPSGQSVGNLWRLRERSKRHSSNHYGGRNSCNGNSRRGRRHKKESEDTVAPPVGCPRSSKWRRKVKIE